MGALKREHRNDGNVTFNVYTELKIGGPTVNSVSSPWRTFTLILAFLQQLFPQIYKLVQDRQTDRRTDGRTDGQDA